MAGWQAGPRNAITDVAGIRVGHHTDKRGGTGCTVILCETATAAAVDTRGGAPGTRETDVLGLSNLVRKCHAIVFTGGSAFGLGAADGVMRYLADRQVGFPTAARPVPIVSAAVLYDLGVGQAGAFPTAEDGFRAATRAKGGAVQMGSVGAGTGASVAKLLGLDNAMKGGLGTASLAGPDGIVVGALVATNAVGSVVDSNIGKTIAGPRSKPGRYYSLAESLARRNEAFETVPGENTTLICVATNAALEPHQLQRICTHAHDGFARAVIPAHTSGDGDIAFSVSMGSLEIAPHHVLTVGALAARAVEIAILRSVSLATSVGGLPAISEWKPS
ncbi:MAG: P1 family peptidase [Dehalococcoidia bacterium]